jgi:phage tail-like protein
LQEGDLMADEQQIEFLAKSRFYVEITLQGSLEKIDGYFMECSGLSRSQEAIEIVEVTPQVWGRSGSTKGRVIRTKLPGNVKSENITLKQGLNISMTMWNWLKAVEDGNWHNNSEMVTSLFMTNLLQKKQGFDLMALGRCVTKFPNLKLMLANLRLLK